MIMANSAPRMNLNQNQDGWPCYEAIRATLDLHISDHAADQGCPTDGHSSSSTLLWNADRGDHSTVTLVATYMAVYQPTPGPTIPWVH